MAKIAFLAFKLALSAVLVFYAFSKIDVSSAWLTARTLSSASLTSVILLFLVQFVLAAFRLRILLAILGARVRRLASLDFVLVGAFFSQTLISFVGGDAMRVWRMVRSRISVGVATKSVLFDRVAGFAGMFLVVLVTAPFLVPMLRSSEMVLGLLLILLGGLAGALAVVLLRRLPERWLRAKPIRLVRDAAATGLVIWRSRDGAVFVVGISIAIQLLNVAILLTFAEGLGIRVDPVDGLLLFPTVLFLSMLPISVAGWGVREGAMIAALDVVGIPAYQSVALSVCFGLCAIAVSLPGGALWFFKKHEVQGAGSGHTLTPDFDHPENRAK